MRMRMGGGNGVSSIVEWRVGFCMRWEIEASLGSWRWRSGGGWELNGEYIGSKYCLFWSSTYHTQVY